MFTENVNKMLTQRTSLFTYNEKRVIVKKNNNNKVKQGKKGKMNKLIRRIFISHLSVENSKEIVRRKTINTFIESKCLYFH